MNAIVFFISIFLVYLNGKNSKYQLLLVFVDLFARKLFEHDAKTTSWIKLIF